MRNPDTAYTTLYLIRVDSDKDKTYVKLTFNDAHLIHNPYTAHTTIYLSLLNFDDDVIYTELNYKILQCSVDIAYTTLYLIMLPENTQHCTPDT